MKFRINRGLPMNRGETPGIPPFSTREERAGRETERWAFYITNLLSPALSSGSAGREGEVFAFHGSRLRHAPKILGIISLMVFSALLAGCGTHHARLARTSASMRVTAPSASLSRV